jgi:hypothetical protein
MNCASPQSVEESRQTSPLCGAGMKKEIVEVVFGTPSKNCTGMGICMVARPNTSILRRIICPSVLSNALLVDRQTIGFEFHRDNMNPAMIMQRFIHPYFMVEEPFMLPVYLVRRWSLETPWVAAGAYPLNFQNNIWRIICRLDQPLQSQSIYNSNINH